MKSVLRRSADAIEAATSPDVARNACPASARTDERCADAATNEPMTHATNMIHTSAVTRRLCARGAEAPVPVDVVSPTNDGVVAIMS
jgi:hypothetical protein